MSWLHTLISLLQHLSEPLGGGGKPLCQRPVTEPGDPVCCIAVAGQHLPQLLAVLPRNSLVLGFHRNSFQSLLSPSFAIF